MYSEKKSHYHSPAHSLQGLVHIIVTPMEEIEGIANDIEAASNVALDSELAPTHILAN